MLNVTHGPFVRFGSIPPPLYLHFDLDPDQAFHFEADPDPAFHFDADPDPGSQKSMRIVLNTVPDIFPEDVCEGATVDEYKASHLFRLQFLDLLINKRINLHTKRGRR